MKKRITTLHIIAFAMTFFCALPMTSTIRAQDSNTASAHENLIVKHKTIKIDDVEIFYREAGPKDAPTLLLLHGFPTSSHMFRTLIPALADKFHVVAPDYPGFG